MEDVIIFILIIVFMFGAFGAFLLWASNKQGDADAEAQRMGWKTKSMLEDIFSRREIKKKYGEEYAKRFFEKDD